MFRLHLGILLSLLILSACGSNDQAHEQHIVTLPGKDPSDSQPNPPAITPPARNVAGQPLILHFDQLTDFDQAMLVKLQEAKRLMDRMLASRQFMEAIFNHHDHNQDKTFVQNNGYGNEELYDFIHLGKETLAPEADHVMNLTLKLYYENSNTIGYTYKGSKTIYVNRKFYATFTPAQIAGNLMHEWMHKAGFSHDYDNTKRRRYSVPYAIGYIAIDLCKKL